MESLTEMMQPATDPVVGGVGNNNSSNNNNNNNNNSNNNDTREEGLLRDVLDELDRERSRRAELEAEIRVLREERAKSLLEDESKRRVEQEKKEAAATRQEWIKLETERDGYRELIDALTADNDAISVAMNKTETTLPLHIVRLMEIMPWDTRAKQHAQATEEVYEWQIYKGGKWNGLVRFFPPSFRKIPIVQPKPGSSIAEDSPTSRRLFGEAPPKQCVLTNASSTEIINIDSGYPLPQDGGMWQWVGGWRVDRHVLFNSTGSPPVSPRHKVDCDEEGWSYAQDFVHFATNPTELCWDHPKVKGNTVQRPFRRRKWTRQRSLLSYPYASERAKHFLRLLAENERNSMISSKLGDQLVETKTKLTETEENYLTTKDYLSQERETLKKELTAREEELYRMLELGLGEGSPASLRSRLVEQIGQESLDRVKGLVSTVVSTSSSALSTAAQTLRKRGDDQTATTDEESSSSEEGQNFDWRKIRGAMGKLSPAGSSILQGMKRRAHDEEEPEHDKQPIAHEH